MCIRGPRGRSSGLTENEREREPGLTHDTGSSTNLAPFSYTQMVNHDPPIFIVGFAGGMDNAKDTLRNLVDTGECTSPFPRPCPTPSPTTTSNSLHTD